MVKHGSKLNTPEKRARIGERIKVASTQAGMSLKELAMLSGTTPTLIYQYVRGIISPPQELIEKIAAITRVHTDFFDPDKEARSTLALRADQPNPPGSPVSDYASEPGTLARIKSEMDHLSLLRDAYLYSKRNLSAYVSTMDQMLGLARAVDNKAQEGWILWQLGKVRIEEHQLDEARSQIRQARKLFMEEGQDELFNLAAMDLAVALEMDGQLSEAKDCLEEAVKAASTDVKWRAYINLGGIYYRMHNNEAALRSFCQAAEQLELMDKSTRDGVGMLYLQISIAEIARGAGHQDEAVMLWNRCMQQATDARMTEHFLEALMNIARTYKDMGLLSEARQRIELAVVLAGFLIDDESRLSIARARLSELLLATGFIDDAKDSARIATRLAHKSRAAHPTIVAALTLAESNLATGQWRDALDYAQEALDEAHRTRRTSEVSNAKEIRARAYLLSCEHYLNVKDYKQAADALKKAYDEASSALEQAITSDTVKEQMAAYITLSRCCVMNNDEAQAEQHADAAIALSSTGAVSLSRILSNVATELPPMLKSPELDLASIFASRSVSLPRLEWQAQYLKGTLAAKRLGEEAGFAAMSQAAQLICSEMSTMTPVESSRFQQSNSEVRDVIASLRKFAITSEAKQEYDRIALKAPDLFAIGNRLGS